MHTNLHTGYRLFLLLLAFCWHISLQAQVNAAARYEIDAKRIGVQPADKDALPRSREFIRLDSTYYVGWMYEGIYKYTRAADYLGYKYAVAPLEKALKLLEKDFDDKLMNLYSSIPFYQQHLQLFNDLFQMHFILGRCYNNLEMADKTMALLQKMESYKFRKDFMCIYTDMAWIYHRNRFFDSSKYPFLKNSIEENEAMAFKHCYLQIEQIKKNKPMNDQWFGYGQEQQDLLTVYHYLALLHNYNKNYDSSQYYYQLLIEGGRVSWGNYANMKHETGNFDESIFYYKKYDYAGSYALQESNYYLPTLYIYGAKPKEGISLARQTIQQSGSTPGFGWYTIALARSYLYDGQLDSCSFFLDKASNFKEIHINTTLTQSQYEFTINLLKVQMLDKKAELLKFYNSGWWYSFSDLYEMLSLKMEKLLLEYALANALAYNPERDRMVYDLFCAEATVSFDESFYLLKDFSSTYFKDKYEKYHLKDTRERVYRYFDLFAAKFDYLEGNEEAAGVACRRLLDEVIALESRGTEKNAFEYDHEKLFVARLYELLALQAENSEDREKYQNRFFEHFPQLVPFSGLRMPVKLKFLGDEDETISEVIDNMKDCNITLADEGDHAPEAIIQFSKKDKTYQAIVTVVDAAGKPVVTNEQVIFKTSRDIGKELVLRLFGKGGATVLDEAPAVASAHK